MAQNDTVHPGFIGLLAALVVFLITIFGMLFAPSAPTASVQSTAIPLDTASSITSPSQIQGTSSGANPQNAAKFQPGDIQNGL